MSADKDFIKEVRGWFAMIEEDASRPADKTRQALCAAVAKRSIQKIDDFLSAAPESVGEKHDATDADFIHSMLQTKGVEDAGVSRTSANSCILRVKIPKFDLIFLPKVTKHIIRLYGNQPAKPIYDDADGWLAIEVQRLK